MPTLVLTQAAGMVVSCQFPDGRRGTIESKQRGTKVRLILKFPEDVRITREKPNHQEPTQ